MGDNMPNDEDVQEFRFARDSNPRNGRDDFGFKNQFTDLTTDNKDPGIIDLNDQPNDTNNIDDIDDGIIDLTESSMGGQDWDNLGFDEDEFDEPQDPTWNVADTAEKWGDQLDTYITSSFNFVSGMIENFANIPKRQKLSPDDVALSGLSHNIIEYLNYVNPQVTTSPMIMVVGSVVALMVIYMSKPVVSKPKRTTPLRKPLTETTNDDIDT